MHCKRWVLRTVAASALALAPAVAAAETYEIKAGQPAPVDGVLFDAEAAVQAARDLSDYRLLQGQEETRKAQVAALEAQVRALSEAIALKEKQAALLQQEIDLHARMEARLEATLATMQKAVETAAAAAEKSTAALEKVQDKVDRANSRTFWGTIGGILLTLAAALAL